MSPWLRLVVLLPIFVPLTVCFWYRVVLAIVTGMVWHAGSAEPLNRKNNALRYWGVVGVQLLIGIALSVGTFWIYTGIIRDLANV